MTGTTTEEGNTVRRLWMGGVAILVAITAAACGSTPGKDTEEPASSAAPAASSAAPATSEAAASSEAATSEAAASSEAASSDAGSSVAAAADDFSSLGDITLTAVSADNQTPGPMDVIQNLSKQFEADHPNVKVDVQFKGFTDHINTVKLNLQSDSAPCIVEGNQGFQIDGDLVKAGLIIPLDDYAKKYGWDQYYTPETMQQFMWSADGKTFGEGNLWGVGQFGQSTGIFYNKAKLQELGIDPEAIPQTFDELEQAMLAIRAKLPEDEPVVMLGNKDGYEIVHLWGMLQGAFEDPQAARDWIFHKDGATFETPGNIESLKHLKTWVDAGIFGKDFNSLGENDAAAQFAKGKGVFYMGGNWQAGVIKDGLGEDVGFVNGPPGASGKPAAIGSTSLPWHISSACKYPDVAAAWINQIIAGQGSAEEMYKFVQIPAIAGAPQPSGDALLGAVAAGWQQLNEAGGLTLFPDWSSPTMFDTMGAAFQKLAAGKSTPEEVAKTLQEDWAKYDAELKGS